MRPSAIAVFLWAAAAAAQETPPGPGWVVLPADQYQSLRRQARPPEPTPAAPPADVAVTRIDYELRVAGALARGTARLTVDVFKEGWIPVPIPRVLNVTSARLDGRTVARVGGPEGRGDAPHVLVARTGRSVLSLEVVLPVAAAAGTESLTLPAVGSGVSRATVVVPKDGIDVTLAGALLAEKTDKDGQSRWVAYGDGQAPIVFSWRRKVEDRRAALPLRFRGSILQHVAFGEESTQLAADVRLDVVQGAAPRVSLAVPEGLTVNRVSGGNVADWEVKAGTLEVTFLDPVSSSEGLVVAGEARSPREGRLDVPLLRLPRAERETGGVGVEVMGAGEIKSADARGMDEADPGDLGPAVAGRSGGLVSAYRFRPQDGASPRALAVTLSRYTPQAVLMAAVEEAWYDALLTDEGRTLVRVRYAVRNNTQSFLVAKLPDGAALWSAAVGGRPVRPGRSAEGAFLLPLRKAEAGEDAPAFLVELVYLESGAAWAREGAASLRLPALDLPVSRTAVMLHYPPRHRVSLQPGAFRAQPYRAPFSRAFAAAPARGEAGREAGKKEGTVPDLVDRLKKAGGGARRLAGILPIRIPFLSYGQAAFLASELTKEGESPVIDLRYKRHKKGGWR